MYQYIRKSTPITINKKQNQKSSSFSAAEFPLKYENLPDIRYCKKDNITPQKKVIQCIKPTEFQNTDGTRTIEVIDRYDLALSGRRRKASEVIDYPILRENVFHEGKQSHISELTSIESGTYMQLGWDNCILFQKGEGEKYNVSGLWEMHSPENDVTEDKKPQSTKLSFNNHNDSPVLQQPALQVADTLVTWGVSSCEVIILISKNKRYIAAMHINNNITLPFSVLSDIMWETAFISIIDDEPEIRRTQELLNTLNPTNIKILNRGNPMDSAANGHNFIGLNLSAEPGPQVFGGQGQIQSSEQANSLAKKIMKCSTWEEAKDNLICYQSLVENLEYFLLSIPPRTQILEQAFQIMKKQNEFRDIFQSYISEAIMEQQFLIDL